MKKAKILILPLLLLTLVVSGCGKKDYSSLEKQLTREAGKFYETNIKDKVIMAGAQDTVQQKITLTALKSGGVDITKFTDKKCNEEESYALVIYSTGDDGLQKGDYKVENHLVCGDYKTAESK